MYDVRLLLAKEQSLKLRPGMSVKVNVQLSDEGGSHTLVPVESVFNQGDASYVWVYNPGNSQVSKQQVQISKLINNGYISINGNLKGNEMIVVAGVHSLHENEEVRVLENQKL